MERLLNALAVLSLGLIVSVLVSVRRAHIRVEYSVSWLLAGFLLLLLSRWTGAWWAIMDFFGAADPPSSLLMVSGVIFLILLYRQSLRVSSLKESNIALTQRLAILEYRLESLHEKIETDAAAG